MKTIKKLEHYMNLIREIRFDNEHGGSYAFMQMLAYNRELIKCLTTLGFDDRLVTRIEAASWMVNEYLGAKFTHRHRLVFDEKKSELNAVFMVVEESLREFKPYNYEEKAVAEPELRRAA